MDVTFHNRMEEYYQRFIDLQEKLRKSEEERLKLEIKFNEMVQRSREEEQAHYRKLRSQYKRFLDEDRKRQERNEKIFRALERIESRVNSLMSKTERFKILRRQYQSYLENVSHTSKFPHLRDNSPQFNDTLESQESLYEKPAPQEVPKKCDEQKMALLDKYLQNLCSKKIETRFEPPSSQNDEVKTLDDLSRKLSANFDSNKANSIAEDIMNSIYNRHYKKNTIKNQNPLHDEFGGLNDCHHDPRNEGNRFDLETIRSTNDNQYNNDSMYFKASGNDKKPSVLQHVLREKVSQMNNITDDSNEKLSFNTDGKAHNSKFDYEPAREINEQIKKIPERNRDITVKRDESDVDSTLKIPENHLQDEQDDCFNAIPRENDLHIKSSNDLTKHVQFEPFETKRNSPLSFQDFPDVKLHHEVIEKQKIFNQEQFNMINEPEHMSEKANSENDKDEKVCTNETVENFQSTENNQQKQAFNETHLVEEDSSKVESKQLNDEQKKNMHQLIQDSQESRQQSGGDIETFDQSMVGLKPPEDSNENGGGNIQSIQDGEQKHLDNNLSVGGKENQNVDLDYEACEGDDQLSNLYYDQNDQPVISYEQQFDENEKADQQYVDPLYHYNESDNIQSWGNGQPHESYQTEFYENGQPNYHHYDENSQQNLQYDGMSQELYGTDDQTVSQPQYDENLEPIAPQQYDENNQSVHPQYDGYDQTISREQYDENGHLVFQHYDENNQAILQQQYDEHGQPLQYDDNGHPIVEQQYDEQGQLIIHEQYDYNGQPVIQQQCMNNDQLMTQLQYDENGQPTSQYDENGQLLYEGHGAVMEGYDIQYDESGQPIGYTQSYDETAQFVNPTSQQLGGSEERPQQFSGELLVQNVSDFTGASIVNDGSDIQQNTAAFGEPVVNENENSFQKEQKQEIPEEDLKKSKNVLDLLDTDTESARQNTSKISNDSDFDFSNG